MFTYLYTKRQTLDKILRNLRLENGMYRCLATKIKLIPAVLALFELILSKNF